MVENAPSLGSLSALLGRESLGLLILARVELVGLRRSEDGELFVGYRSAERVEEKPFRELMAGVIEGLLEALRREQASLAVIEGTGEEMFAVRRRDFPLPRIGACESSLGGFGLKAPRKYAHSAYHPGELPPAHGRERQESMNLSDLKIIVTGGAQGMGAHFAKRLLEAGASVAVGDVNEEKLAELPEGIHRRRLDVSDPDDIEAFVKWAADSMGGINSLINNAGIIRDGLLVKKDRHSGEIVKFPKKDWDAVIGVNLTGAVFMVREVVAHMIENDTR